MNLTEANIVIDDIDFFFFHLKISFPLNTETISQNVGKNHYYPNLVLENELSMLSSFDQAIIFILSTHHENSSLYHMNMND